MEQYDGATSQSTGSLHPHEPTPENPHVYRVTNPTASDIANAANRDDYPREFTKGGYMTAWLTYTKPYRPKADWWSKYYSDWAFIGNRNPKYTVPNYLRLRGTEGIDAFKKWWAELPNTIPERKYIHGQMRGVISALSFNDIPLALSLLDDINLAVSPDHPVSDGVKRNLVKALNDAMFPAMWDYMDPKTRPPMPYTPLDDLSNSGTQSGTSITISGTGVLSGTSITLTVGSTAT